jgi:hypothetical protein
LRQLPRREGGGGAGRPRHPLRRILEVALPLAMPGIIVRQRYLMRGMTLGAAYG